MTSLQRRLIYHGNRMNRSQRIDSIRNIKKQIVSYLSIIIISSFAITAYLGLTFSARALANSAKKLYTSANFRDIEVSSNCLLSEDDITAIQNLECVSEVEKIRKVNARVSSDITTKNIVISTLPKIIGTPALTGGSLPENKDECIIEKSIADALDLKIGDEIAPLDAYDEEPVEMDQTSFILTGIFTHAEHATFDNDEAYCMLVLDDAFDKEQFDFCYSSAQVVIKKPSYRYLFDKRYEKLVDKCVDEIEELGKQRSNLRYEDQIAFLSDHIEDSETELKDAKSKLSLASKMVSSMNSKTGAVMADMSNMLSVIIDPEPSEYKTADEQISDYEDAQKSYDNAVKKVDDAKKRLNKLSSAKKSRWYVFTRNANIGYMGLKTNSQNLENLNSTFSILFVFIAILVIFASLSRMVNEQRSLIGISKALGMHFTEVFEKYFVFGFSAVSLGIILGFFLSLYVIEFVIAVGYEEHFIFGRFPFMADAGQTIITIIIAIIVAICAIYFSCRKLLKQTAKKLLSTPVPKGHTHLLKKSSILAKMPLYSRMIILNIGSDIVRVVVTILAVAGCCSLIVIGFTLKDSIMGALTRQVSMYTKYDIKVMLNTSSNDNAAENVGKVLEEAGASKDLVYTSNESLQVDDTIEYVGFWMSDNIEEISKYHPIIDSATGKPMKMFPKEGILVTKRFAESYDLKVGDSIYILDYMGYKCDCKIGGIVNNYIGRYVFMQKSYYEKVVQDSFKDNTYFVILGKDTDEEALISSLSETEGFDSLSYASEVTASFESLILVLDMIVVLLIVLAGVMALFVLLNLANMYLLTKHSEIVIMRINGFTVRETIAYIIREVILTTSLGIILGIGFGIVIVYTILRRMEQVHLMFVRTPNAFACFMGALITSVFTAVIYAISLKKVKNLNLKDAAN